MIRYREELSSAEKNFLRSNRGLQKVIVLSRGCYILKQDWDVLYGEGRQIAMALAHSDRERVAPVFSHYTAAALLGIPLYRFAEVRVHETNPPGGVVRSTTQVMRHKGVLTEHDVVEIAGVKLTSASRTVFDTARSARAEVALGCADAMLNREYFASRKGRPDLQECWREGALAQLNEMPGVRGVRRARKLLTFADGRAESVLESVGRLRFVRAGIQVEIQSRVPGPNKTNHFTDFKLIGHNAFAEADGESKYFEEEMTKGRDPKQLLREEKDRKDWIRGTTKKPIYRFGSKDAATQELFEARFASFGVVGNPTLRREGARIL